MRPLFFRIAILVCLWVLLTLVWYFCLEKALWVSVMANHHLRIQREETLMQLQTLGGLKEDYLYADELVSSSLQDVLQGLATNTGGLVMTDFTDEGTQLLSSEGDRFALAAQAVGIDWLPQLSQHTVTVKLKGSFIYFLRYLQALQQDPRRLYFQSVDFNMKIFPKAEITLTVFTLGVP